MMNTMKTKKTAVSGRTVQKARKRRGGGTYRSYLIILLSLMVIFVLAGGLFGYLGFQVYNHDGIYDGVTVAGVDLSGMSRREAAEAIDAQMQSLLDNMTFQIQIDEDTFEVTPEDLNIAYSVDAAAAEAYHFGREGSFFSRVGAIFRARMNGYAVDFAYTYDLDAFDKIAKEIAEKVNVSESQTSYEIQNDTLVLTVGTAERYIDPLDISQALLDKFENNTTGDIVLTTGSGGRDQIDLEALKKEIDREPVDAYLDEETDPDNPVVVPEENGLELDVTAAAAILAMEGSGPDHNIYRIPLVVTEPEV